MKMSNDIIAIYVHLIFVKRSCDDFSCVTALYKLSFEYDSILALYGVQTQARTYEIEMEVVFEDL